MVYEEIKHDHHPGSHLFLSFKTDILLKVGMLAGKEQRIDHKEVRV